MKKMVQDKYGPRSYWQQDDGRYSDTWQEDSRGRPMHIGQALREHCKINARVYFLATVNEDGSTAVFSSNPSEIDPTEFFDEDKFKRATDRTGLDASTSAYHGMAMGYGGPSNYGFGIDSGRFSSRDHSRDPLAQAWDHRPRKRNRAGVHRDTKAPFAPFEDPVRDTVTASRSIEVGKEHELYDFYEQRFKDCQQTACKLIAKAWIKTVEPKKQSLHPYTGKEAGAPEWWPKPWGESKDERVRHKEPDHLYKKERVHLLKHMLGLVIPPQHQQHPDIRHLGLNVAKLEEVTLEALSSFFTDKENPSNFRKKKYLDELFKIAKSHQRYKHDEIDGTTRVYVNCHDKDPEDMDEDELVNPFRNDDEQGYTTRHSSSGSTPKGSTPHSLVAVPHQDADHAGASRHVHGGVSYHEEASARGSTQYIAQQSLMSGMQQSDHSPYVDAGGMQATAPTAHLTPGGFMYATSHDSSRRSSMFSPTDTYTSPPTSLYTPWSTTAQGPATTVAPPSSSSSMFAYQTSTQQQPSPAYQTSTQQQQNPSPVHAHYLDHSPGGAGPLVGGHHHQPQHPQHQYTVPSTSNFDGLPRSGDVGSDFGSHHMMQHHRASLPSHQPFAFGIPPMSGGGLGGGLKVDAVPRITQP